MPLGILFRIWINNIKWHSEFLSSNVVSGKALQHHGKSLQYPLEIPSAAAVTHPHQRKKYTEEILLYPDPIIRKKCTAPNHFYVPQKYFPFILKVICLPLRFFAVMVMCDGDV